MTRKYTVDELPWLNLTTRNKRKVPKKTWARWPALAKLVFNQQYDMMAGNQDLFLHPDQAPVPRNQWTTTCWNTAWGAADCVVDGLDHIIGED